MKAGKILVLAGLTLAWLVCDARAVDFKIRGHWMFGVSGAETTMVHKYRNAQGQSITNKQSDYLQGQQRLRTLIEAIVSENISGAVQFQMGTPKTLWGKANGVNGGAALGADSPDMLVVRQAYLDWMIPQADIKVRMGIQPVSLPDAAGGAIVLQSNVAGVTANWRINDMLGLTALWLRPLNDNYAGEDCRDAAYLDNVDLFGFTVPVKIDGLSLTPWAVYGIRGKNALSGYRGYNGDNAYSTADGNLNFTFNPYPEINGRNDISKSSRPYGSLFWAGLPVKLTMFEPLNFELDLIYGYVESMGRYDAVKYGGSDWQTPEVKRSSTRREGFVAKALLEYKMGWGAPGILGWYGSGDTSNPKNGSQRLPSIVGWGNFTSFMGDGNRHTWAFRDINGTYAGTWGVGAQLRDFSFLENLEHTFKAVWWGGTNSSSMAKYMNSAYAWQAGEFQYDGPYMTTNDGLLEFNLDTNYKMYENLNVNLTLGYIANFMDNATWNKAGKHNTSFSRQDLWKAMLVFEYSF